MSAAEKPQPPAVPQPPSLIAKFAGKFGVEPNKMLSTLKATAFKGDVTNEQMMALLIVADQYGLNPWTKEIYAFPDKNNGIVPVVGVDGWSRIINSNPNFDGMSFQDAPDGSFIECTIWRKDRTHPISVTEYLSECKRNTGPWGSHPRRMLRHKAMIQCARVAFGYVGIYDEDEAERIIDGQHHVVVEDEAPAIAAINAKVKGGSGATIDSSAQRVENAPPPAEPKKSAGPTPAEVGALIVGAKTLEELDEARSLISGFPDDIADQLRKEAEHRAAQLGFGTKDLL